MKIAAGIVTATAGTAVALLAAPALLVSVVQRAQGPLAAASAMAGPSAEAVADIPAILLPAFIREAAECPGLPWPVLAGISRVESNHGRYGGSAISPTGAVSPPIIGIPLDGTNGTARIEDSDDGKWDHDTTWDRAVGPFQFIPSSWRIFGGDGNGDGVADPNNILDALPAMRRHLCPQGQVTDVHAAIYSYNHSDAYVEQVLGWARRYAATAAPVAGGYALPVPSPAISPTDLIEPHHDYPAWDAPVPVGTPVLAITSGTVVTASAAGIYPSDPNRCGSMVAIAGADGAHYVYCHLSTIAVSSDQSVDAGTPIGFSGGLPGASGAGNTTGAHLHLGVRVAGAAICPQPILLAIAQGHPIAPSLAPTTGCVSGDQTVDWSHWLHQRPHAEATR